MQEKLSFGKYCIIASSPILLSYFFLQVVHIVWGKVSLSDGCFTEWLQASSTGRFSVDMFIPNAQRQKSLLQAIDVEDVAELFADIPSDLRVDGLDLPQGVSQQEVTRRLRKISRENMSFYDMPSFLGGGVVPHFVPAVVREVVGRSEFLTSYTPYQSEASQGFLQAMFEYQSMLCELTGMDVANCSMYDGATALAEAALMCNRLRRKRQRFLVSANVSWERRSVLRNYARGPGIQVEEIPFDRDSGCVDTDELQEMLGEDVCGVYAETPNFFGVFEPHLSSIVDMVHDAGALVVAGVNPLSLGVVKAPGSFDADIVVGEGRGLGNPMSLGGPGLGVFACKEDFLRQMPGRIIGATINQDGKRAFCMALQTREQHIRRRRATSNICTNEALNALAAAVYLSWLGGAGLWRLAQTNMQKAQQCQQATCQIDGFTPCFSGNTFNEFVVQSPISAPALNEQLLQHDIIGGVDLGRWYDDLEDCVLFGVGELHSDEMIQRLVDALEEVTG